MSSAKRVAVVGLGVSNIALVELLLERGARVVCCDIKDEQALGSRYQQLAALASKFQGRLEFRLGENYLSGIEDAEEIYLTPGMKKSIPEVVRARERGAEISCEVGLFLKLCKAPVIGITGSAGKSTTTTLVGEMLKRSKRRVYVGGNLGTPLINLVEDIRPDDLVVMELSSFQLELLKTSPHIAALLNISPNHLDVHQTMENYVSAKQNIFLHQGPNDIAVFNLDCSRTYELSQMCSSSKKFFSIFKAVEDGAYESNGMLKLVSDGDVQPVCSAGDIRLRGRHNVSNMLAAFILAHAAGASVDALREVALSFTGLEHRLEFVRELDGVKYYNDSIATSPDRAIAALNSFEEPIVLIAGGYDKGIPFDSFAEAVVASRVRHLIVLGKTGPVIQEKVELAKANRGEGDKPEISRVRDYREAVEKARSVSKPGDIVLLSPACASYDMFENFEERGKTFKRLVHLL